MKNLLSPYPLREKKEKIPILAISWIDHDLFATVNQLSDLLFAQPLVPLKNETPTYGGTVSTP